MRTPAALQAFGPTAFGLTEPFMPVEGETAAAEAALDFAATARWVGVAEGAHA
jgi:hypothetical protein